MSNAEKAVDMSKVNSMKNEIEMQIAKVMLTSNREVTIKQIIGQLEKQEIINVGDSNEETGQVKTQPDGYVYEIKKDEYGNWQVTYIGTGEIAPVEIVIVLSTNTTGITNEVIITMTAKAESGITSYTLPKGTPQSVESGTKEITQTVTATENGTYVFTVVNGNGESVTKSIKIDNILKDVIQMSANPSEYTYDNVTVTITWPERSNQAVKQIKIGESAWQTVTGSRTQLTVTQNTIIRAKVQNSVADIISNTLTVNNILQAGIIPIYTEEQLLKIGTGEVIEIDSKLYAFETNKTYELKNDFEFTGDYRETASRIKENGIQIKGNDYEIIVTTAEGVKEYYTENSKYYIATNKYGYVLDGLQAYYDGIDNTGTGVHSTTATVWKDLSGNGRDGVLTNFGMNAISGWGKDNLSFDGINDWVNCGELNIDYMTIEALCLRKSEYGGNQKIVGNWETGGGGLGIDNNTFFGELYINDGYKKTYPTEVIKKYDLNTATITNDGERVSTYINGNKKSSIEATGTVIFPSSDVMFVLGANPSYKEQPDGDYAQIDMYSTRIYNRALTDEEIAINSKADEERYKKREVIPVYTAEQVQKMGSGERVYVEQENKTYNYENGAIYEYKNDIEVTTNYIDIINKLNQGKIFIKLNDKVLKSGEDYYTSNSKYSIAVNEYGYVKEDLELLLDGIDNTGSGHSNTTEVWKDLSGNGRDGTLNNTTAISAWSENGIRFDGEDDYVLIEQMDYANPTLEVVGLTSVIDGPSSAIMGNVHDGGYGIGVNKTSARVQIFIAEDNDYMFISKSGVEKNRKFSVASTYNGNRITHRVNSMSTYVEENGTISFSNNDTHIILGANPTGTTIENANARYAFDGTIYSARMYSRALTDGELSANYLTDIERYYMSYVPIYTAEELLKIGTGEYVSQGETTYKFDEGKTYVLQNNLSFSGEYSNIARLIKENKIDFVGNNYEITVTNSEGIEEYYTNDNKYYIATNKYGYVLDGLELYYDGIDNTGSGYSSTASVWKDLSGKNRDGTLKGKSTIGTGDWTGEGLVFDGSDDWVSIGEMNYANISVETVFTSIDLSKTSKQYIVANVESGGYELTTLSTEISRFSAYISGAYQNGTDVSVSNGVRYSVMGSYDGTEIKNRCNNQTYSTTYSGTIGFPAKNTIMALGTNPSGSTSGGGHFAGTIHSVRIYSKALTDEEAQLNYKADQARFGV